MNDQIQEQKRIALLIDAENISAQYASYIMSEATNYGVCSYKRIYGSWDKIVKTKWESEISKNSLKPMMQVNNTRGKNATDSALIIDAMDILYKGNVEIFCIVSSDSDFTYLARRLMESGMMVIGMGESDKATIALENAFDKFVYIDMVAKQAEEEAAIEKAEKLKEEASGKVEKVKHTKSQNQNNGGNIPSKRAVENRIKQIIMENDDKSKTTDLGQVGSELNRIFKNFDVRYYNKKGGKKYKYLKEFVADFKSLKLTTTKDNRVYVSIK